MQETELVLIRNQLSTLVRFFTRIASFLRYWTDLHAGEAQQMIQDGSRDDDAVSQQSLWRGQRRDHF
jgi:hypothetical protein